MTRRPRITNTAKFKQQIVNLYKQGKYAKDIIREYDLTASTFHKWINDFHQSQSFSEKDSQSPEQAEFKNK